MEAEMAKKLRKLNDDSGDILRFILNQHYLQAQWHVEQARELRDSRQRELEKAQEHYAEMCAHLQNMETRLKEVFGKDSIKGVESSTLELRRLALSGL